MSEARIAVAASVSSQGVVWDELDRPSSWVHERTKGPESRALAAPGAGEEPDEIVSFPEWREVGRGLGTVSAGRSKHRCGRFSAGCEPVNLPGGRYPAA